MEAHDLVKNYHHPQELKAAFETLDDHYGKPTMVSLESLRNLRTMKTAMSINDVKENRVHCMEMEYIMEDELVSNFSAAYTLFPQLLQGALRLVFSQGKILPN